jgi:hypothetical protein
MSVGKSLKREDLEPKYSSATFKSALDRFAAWNVEHETMLKMVITITTAIVEIIIRTVMFLMC